MKAMQQVQSGEKTLEEAVKEHSEGVVERGATEVQMSKSQTFYAHDWENFKNSPFIRLGSKPSTEIGAK